MTRSRPKPIHIHPVEQAPVQLVLGLDGIGIQRRRRRVNRFVPIPAIAMRKAA